LEHINDVISDQQWGTKENQQLDKTQQIKTQNFKLKISSEIEMIGI
jgi:hypothetical protein